ncbi:hypothetical protein BTE56_06780 [Agrobacterium pusense]|nr:hypothetical protein BTE56_06780 [Agrobacterium pusense]
MSQTWVWFTPLCPAGHLPLKEGDRQGALSPLHSLTLILAKPCRISISPPVGEMPGRAEGGKATPTDTPQRLKSTTAPAPPAAS